MLDFAIYSVAVLSLTSLILIGAGFFLSFILRMIRDDRQAQREREDEFLRQVYKNNQRLTEIALDPAYTMRESAKASSPSHTGNGFSHPEDVQGEMGLYPKTGESPMAYELPVDEFDNEEGII